MRLKYVFFALLLFCCPLLQSQTSYSVAYLQRIVYAKPQTLYDSLMTTAASFSATDTAKATVFFMEALDIAVKENNIKKRVLTNIALGEMCLDKKVLRKAYGYFFRARNLMGEITADTEGGLASFGIARTQFAAGNYSPATLNFLATIYATQKTKDKSLESEATEYLGLIYSNFQDYNESLSYYRKSYDLKKQLNDDKSCLRIAEKLGDIYNNNRRFDSAFYYAHLSVQLAETLQLPHDIALARLNKAAVLIRLNKIDNAHDELRYFYHKMG